MGAVAAFSVGDFVLLHSFVLQKESRSVGSSAQLHALTLLLGCSRSLGSFSYLSPLAHQYFFTITYMFSTLLHSLFLCLTVLALPCKAQTPPQLEASPFAPSAEKTLLDTLSPKKPNTPQTLRSAENSTMRPTTSNKSTAEKALEKFKFGGYVIGQYTQHDRQDVASDGSFNLRLFRLYGNGYIAGNFYYRFQFEVNDAPGTDRGPRVLDAFVDWQAHKALRIKLGQFKRAFGYENPIAPPNVGMGSFSRIALRLQSINDRIGEHRSSGRDVGLVVHGSLLPQSHKHELLHYQIGVYNGQGVNHTDENRHKDFIASLSLEPIKQLHIGAFVWDGRYTGTSMRTIVVDDKAQTVSEKITLPRRRYNLGVKYEGNWTARLEYAHSHGGTLKGGPNKSDGWYALVGIPTKVKGLKIYGRWDAYRDDATTWQKTYNNYALSANYWLDKNLMFQLGVSHTDDYSLSQTADRHYNTVDFQIMARF